LELLDITVIALAEVSQRWGRIASVARNSEDIAAMFAFVVITCSLTTLAPAWRASATVAA
jgi:ABC-type lipoprotein release transport system permease subunit